MIPCVNVHVLVIKLKVMGNIPDTAPLLIDELLQPHSDMSHRTEAHDVLATENATVVKITSPNTRREIS
jgi:hypothetical protein